MPPIEEYQHRTEKVAATWRCFCCHDTGKVIDPLLLMGARSGQVDYLEATNRIRQQPPYACRRHGCNAAAKLVESYQYLLKAITPEECEYLHSKEQKSFMKAIRQPLRVPDSSAISRKF
ncbi:MAG: hypothetical protein DDT26_00118 [Dehalococcoidia bacterium]|nr:hypothetical protein [Chloroflexota bacterium]